MVELSETFDVICQFISPPASAFNFSPVVLNTDKYGKTESFIFLSGIFIPSNCPLCEILKSCVRASDQYTVSELERIIRPKLIPQSSISLLYFKLLKGISISTHQPQLKDFVSHFHSVSQFKSILWPSSITFMSYCVPRGFAKNKYPLRLSL